MAYRVQPSDMLFRYVPEPSRFHSVRETNVFGDWWRVNVYQEAEKFPGVWGLRMAASYMVRVVEEQYLDFHRTTPCPGD